VKFSIYTIVLIFSLCSSYVSANGGTGTPFPTNGSIINLIDGDVTGTGLLPTGGSIIQPNIGGQIIINPDDTISDWLRDPKINSELGSGTGTGGLVSSNSLPDLLDLSSYTVMGDLNNIRFDGFTKLKVVEGKSASMSVNAIVKDDVLITFDQIKEQALSAKAKNQYQMYVDKVKGGQIDLMFITDKEDKIILMDSSKIK